MLYIAGALIFYVWMAAHLVTGEAPETWRAVVGRVLECTLVAALWPLVLGWVVLTEAGSQAH